LQVGAVGIELQSARVGAHRILRSPGLHITIADAREAERIGLVSRAVPEDDLLDACYQLAERMAAFSRPGIELTKRTLWSGLDAASLEGHMQAEGLGQLFVRLLTANFEEAVAARAEKRPAVFTDDK